MDDIATPTVIDAEEVEDPSTAQDDAKLLLSLEEMIRNNRSLIEATRKELSENRDMLKDTFENDPIYVEQNEEVKKVTKVRNATKAQILKKVDIASLAEKVKSLQSQLKEAGVALSDYLREYQRVSGSNTFEGENGEVLEIVYTAKLRSVEKIRR